MVLKDFGATSGGDPYHEGTRFLRDAGWTAREDSYAVRRFRRAGFVIVGRTNVPELASAATTESDAYGATHNPWDPDRSPGGSSGGSAAAVAAGMVALAHGTDGGGSIRIPASECALVGLKPSRGRISCGPAFGEGMGGMASDFALTRSVRDATALLDVLSGPEPGDPYTAPGAPASYAKVAAVEPGCLRIGLRVEALAMTGGAGVTVHPDCAAAVQSAAQLLESLGHYVERAHPAELDEDDITMAMGTAFFVENARALDHWSALLGRELGPADVDADNWAMVEAGRATTAPAYVAALHRIHLARRRIAEWFDTGFDLLLTPTAAEPPPLLGYLATDPDAPLVASMRAVPYSTFTSAFNLTGQPAISLPLHWTDDALPIGVQLVAAYGREDVLVQVAAQVEAAQPWGSRRPPVSVPD
jgi:amidase